MAKIKKKIGNLFLLFLLLIVWLAVSLWGKFNPIKLFFSSTKKADASCCPCSVSCISCTDPGGSSTCST